MLASQEPGRVSSIVVHTNHPIVLRNIERLLASAPYRIEPFPHREEGQGWVLILDTYSVEEWLEIAIQCHAQRGRSIIIVPEFQQSYEEELRLIYLGIRGIVPISNLENVLIHAVDSVARGHLWLRRKTLDACMLQRDPARIMPGPLFTVREEQIIALLLKRFSNKKIGGILGISDRTVKFHVSNILRKFNLKSRKDLIQKEKTAERRNEPVQSTVTRCLRG